MKFKNINVLGFDIEVNHEGIIKKDGNVLRQNENHDGYLVVYVGNNRNIGVHRLVAMAFVENDEPEVKVEVNHIDFNRKNNSPNNLEWLTHADNVRYSHVNGRYKKKFGEDNPNFGNRSLSKYYSENPDIAKEKQSRKGSKNGKATPIELYKDSALVQRFEYIGDCCEYLHINHGFPSNPESIRSSIRRSMKKNIPYRGFTFKK